MKKKEIVFAIEYGSTTYEASEDKKIIRTHRYRWHTHRYKRIKFMLCSMFFSAAIKMILTFENLVDV